MEQEQRQALLSFFTSDAGKAALECLARTIARETDIRNQSKRSKEQQEAIPLAIDMLLDFVEEAFGEVDQLTVNRVVEARRLSQAREHLFRYHDEREDVTY